LTESILGDEGNIYALEKNTLTEYELRFTEDKFLLV